MSMTLLIEILYFILYCIIMTGGFLLLDWSYGFADDNGLATVLAVTIFISGFHIMDARYKKIIQKKQK